MAKVIRKSWLWLPALGVLVLSAAVGWLILANAGVGTGPPSKPAGPIPIDAEPAGESEATYVGTARCATCHAEQMQSWEGSHHDRAMEVPSEETVEGNFGDVTFTKKGVTSRFYRKDGDFFIRTEGADGQMEDYKVVYTFGVYPLQQYLVETNAGRLQVLPLCWDNRPEKQGGQRWFHIHPDQRIKPDDPLFWTRPLQNWNRQCAECHSTNLKKNYDPKQDAYHTSFAQLDVSCEACHGPGSDHIDWANEAAGYASDSAEGKHDELSAKQMGLTVGLKPDQPATWTQDPETGQPKRTEPLQSRVQMQVCSRCHARRGVMSEHFVPGDDWLQTHRPRLLDQPLYESDGRIREEVYVWGSFRQSKMYHKGVRCTDCHNPHSLELELPKKQMCLKCHSGDKYATKDHHFHEPGTQGASCISCHMPQETYMVVDPRRDHSFRIPRPDRSVRLGTRNTCNDCHGEKSFEWAAEHYRQWWGDPGADDRPYAAALDAAWEGHPAAGSMLNQAARNTETPTIAQATALARLSNYPGRASLQTIQRQLDADSPLMRLAGIRALEAYQSPQRSELRWQLGAPLLDDANRMVRIEAARVLAGTRRSMPGPNRSSAYQKALEELRAYFQHNADQPGALVTKGNLALAFERSDKAIAAYRTAIERDPHAVAAYNNLADLYRSRGNEQKVMEVLRQGLERVPEAPALHQAMGLSLSRQNRTEAAIESLKKAHELGPANPQLAYMLAVAYHSAGQSDKALDTLKQAIDRHPRHGQLLTARATIARDAGRYNAALDAAKRLNDLAPGNRRYQQLYRQIQRLHRAE
jgi:tetratricopeptide (TPR) repeat protein